VSKSRYTAINLEREAHKLDAHWSPKVVGRVNDQYVKVAKLKGDFVWHKHDAEDEMFLVLSGSLKIEHEDHVVELQQGDVHIVPRGVLHKPVCKSECLVALIEPMTTEHTGGVVTPKTKSISDQLGEAGDPAE